MVTYTLPVDRDAPYSAASMFLAALAYPEAVDDLRRREFGTALQIHAVKLRSRYEPEWGRSPQWLHPVLVAADHTKNERHLKTGFKRLGDRLACAYFILWPTLAKHLGARNITVKGFAPTVNNMTIQLAFFLHRESESTVKTKLWKPSWPVIHAAAAYLLWNYEEKCITADEQRRRFTCFMFSNDVEDVIETSEFIRKQLRQISKFRLPKSRLIKFETRDGCQNIEPSKTGGDGSDDISEAPQLRSFRPHATQQNPERKLCSRKSD